MVRTVTRATRARSAAARIRRRGGWRRGAESKPAGLWRRPIGLTEGRYVLVTLHRPSNVDEPGRLSAIVDALTELAGAVPGIFPNGLPAIATAAVLGILLNAIFLIFKPATETAAEEAMAAAD